MKFEPKFISVTKNPIIVIGENPGPKKGEDTTDLVWERGEPSKLLLSIVNETGNVILTNICNYREKTVEHIDEGIEDLKELIRKYQPPKIITLGNFANSHVFVFLDTNIPVYKFMHPAYVVRFGVDREKYVSEMLAALS